MKNIAILVLTYPDTHAAISIAAMEIVSKLNGKAVYLEKYL